ncbi:MAG: transcription-repair coupling factor [Bacteroidales bacterium]|nr:transcription-repair coupling factor [Bacteroidales bacterium]MBN2821485.1 transcription-repair coupling factor [Bacteroidales bacterium]
MNIADFSELFKKHSHYEPLRQLLERNNNERISLKGIYGSFNAFFISTLLREDNNQHFFFFEDKDSAAYFFNDLVNISGDNENILFFPSSYKRSVQYKQPESGNIILRTNVLNKILQNKTETKQRLIIVSYPEALSEKVASSEKIIENTLHLHQGEKISIGFIHEVLDEYGFELVDFVYEPGQYALRGSLVDIFSFSAENPFRIDFFGDEVESIRSFDVETQLSKNKFNKISILPNLETRGAGNKISVLSAGTADSFVWCDNISLISERISGIYDAMASKSDTESIENQLWMGSQFLTEISEHSVLEFAQQTYFPKSTEFLFETKSQPAFKKNFNLLGDNLRMHLAQEYTTCIFSDNEKQIERLKDIFQDTHLGINFTPVIKSIHGGFIEPELKLCFYTDHEIFDRYHKYQIHNYQSSKAALSLRELKDLKPGDYVVHIDHGIGRFGGLEKIEQQGKLQETIRLVYRDNDVLYVSIHNLHRISKYKGKDDAPPKMYKLGSGAWEKLKTNTKKKVKDIAKDLIALYAKRKAEQGFKFSPDTYLQEELEASFIYEDTPDQLKATQAVKGDMEKLIPMDRLICGDVGFGKTEVAIRAAFKAISDSKQVAVLVPTTILALQHYKTFKERLQNFPATINYISRLKKPADQKKILKEVAGGNIDVLIGTHRLIGKDVKFKDLGLLIIDEEQKFGVAAKEKLKALKVNVDTLTMTATPIPRTLQFSLMGARDLSVINTPPPNRHPIITELHSFNEDIIQEGINFEVSRGGQVFFIHNRVLNILEVEALIKRLCPKVKTVVGHGQMEGPVLEKIMIDFMNGDYDVLIATTIIESGLDIPNANTIFINNAQSFGLSDLHQLRGRVGRSNRKAFCYLLAPPLTSVTPEARRRLKAIEEFSDLGSGFHIALQDLDIRGAGNMIGAEQSGFIADIGFETYNRILDEAMQELKETEFKDLFEEEKIIAPKEKIRYVTDCNVDTDLEINIPDSYVENISERIRLYREIDSLNKNEELENFQENLKDRFGDIPHPTDELLRVVRLRWLAMDLGFEKIILRNKKLIAHFVSNQESAYYQSPEFVNILTFVQQKPQLFRMKEGNNKLTLTIDNVSSINKAFHILEQMLPETNKE